MYKDLLETARSLLSGWLSNLRNCISHICQGTRTGHINIKMETKQPSSIFSRLFQLYITAPCAQSWICLLPSCTRCGTTALPPIKTSSDLFRLFKQRLFLLLLHDFLNHLALNFDLSFILIQFTAQGNSLCLLPVHLLKALPTLSGTALLCLEPPF